MSITPQDITFMETNRSHYNTLIQAEFLTNIGYDVKEGMLNVARKFDPAYQANLWCGPCVCELLKYAYVQFDKWKEQNVQHATFPVNEEPHGIEAPTKRKYTKMS